MESILLFLNNNGAELAFKIWEHLYISLIAASLGIIVAVPCGVLLTRIPKVADLIMGILNIVQTFPSFAILAFFIPLFGIGKIPAILVLFVYSVLPILRNTYIGVSGLDKNFIEAGKAMGMTSLERIIYVELPLAVPVIMSGIRISTVYLIGWATLAAFIGGGGLGDLALRFGYQRYQSDVMLVTVLILVVLVQLLQMFGDKLAALIQGKTQ